MSGHTHGKLIARSFSIYAEDGKTPVADTCLNNSVAGHDVANARRLAACWNALEDLSQDALDGGWTRAGLEAYGNRMKAQRDSLQAALETFMERVEEPPAPSCSCCIAPPCNDCVEHAGLREAFEMAREAIAKAEAS